MGVLAQTGRLARGAFSRAFGAVSYVISAGRGNTITFSEFLEELDALGLKGKTFGPERYRAALGAYLGTRIEVIVVDDGDPAARRVFAEGGRTAVLWCSSERELARILVLASLSPLEMSASIYHELSHLAAGHLPRRGHPPVRTAGRARLARKAPPVGGRAREVEARLREEYCLLAGALGSACLASDDLRQIR